MHLNLFALVQNSRRTLSWDATRLLRKTQYGISFWFVLVRRTTSNSTGTGTGTGTGTSTNNHQQYGNDHCCWW